MAYTRNQHVLSQWILRNFRRDDTALSPPENSGSGAISWPPGTTAKTSSGTSRCRCPALASAGTAFASRTVTPVSSLIYENFFLMEAKWHQSPTPAADLHIFEG